MNYKMIGRIISQILAIEAVFMVPAAIIGFADKNVKTALAFVISIAALGAVAGLLYALCRRCRRSISARDGMISVAAS